MDQTTPLSNLNRSNLEIGRPRESLSDRDIMVIRYRRRRGLNASFSMVGKHCEQVPVGNSVEEKKAMDR